jgi:hypothetical protein
LAGADPFGGKADPFTAPVDDAFGDSFPTAHSSSAVSGPPSIGGDPFSLTLKDSLHSSSKPPAKDPFAGATTHNDPFAPSAGAKAVSVGGKGGSDLFGSDPFQPTGNTTTQDDWFNPSGAFQAPKIDGVSR